VVLAAGDARIGRDRPLIVGDAEDHRRVIDAGEGERFVEIAFCGRAFADITQRQTVIAFIGAGHRPAHRVAEAAAQIAGQRIEAEFARRIENGKLTAPKRVLLVREYLVDQIDHGIVASHQPSQHPIGAKAHVARPHRHGLGGADGFLASGLHKEAGLALAVGAKHPLLEQPCEQHGAQSVAKRLRVQRGRPGPHGASLLVQDADQAIGHLPELLGGGVRARARRRAGHGNDQMAEIGRLTRARRRFGNVKV